MKKPSEVKFLFPALAVLTLFLLLLPFVVRKGANSTKPTSHGQVLAKQNRIAVSSPSATPFPTSQIAYSGFCLNVPMLMYHHIEPVSQAKLEGHAGLTVDSNIFDSHMNYLAKQGYRFITAEELVNALINHRALGKAVAITVDDGYSDAYTYAFPIAQKYRVLLNLMIPTGLLNNTGYMSWGNLKEMTSSGLATAYDHTWSHSSLPADSNAKAQFEILTAKKQLEDNLGKTVDIFTYPYGSENNNTISLLKSDGFIGAISTIPGTTQCDSNIMTLRRTRVGNASLSSYGL